MECLDLRDLAEELDTLREMRDGRLYAAERMKALEELEGQLFNQDLAEYARNAPTLIPDGEFEEYAEEYAYDVGFAERESSNPLHSFIDWDGWAESLKVDYTEVTFEGRVYLIRAY